MNREKLNESLRVHEGIKLKPYTDTEGHLTIGIGHNLDNGITIQQAYALLDSDVDICIKELDRYFPIWKEHSEQRQNVLIELMFNMGAPRLTGFSRMWSALEKHDYKLAAIEMLDSKWAAQVGKRARTLAKQMETGEWPQT